MSWFTAETFDFLIDLDAHNDQAWMDENRDRYETHVKDAMYAFCDELAEPLRERVSPHLVSIGRIQRGSVMQINRDVRFSEDKTPYRTAAAAGFDHDHRRDGVASPGLYLHLEPGNCFMGGGVHSPPTSHLTPIRERIVERTEEWDAVATSVREAGFAFGGGSLKTSPRGFDIDHPRIEDLRRTSFVIMHPLDEDEVTSPQFMETFLERAEDTRPFLAFLSDAAGVPF